MGDVCSTNSLSDCFLWLNTATMAKQWYSRIAGPSQPAVWTSWNGVFLLNLDYFHLKHFWHWVIPYFCDELPRQCSPHIHLDVAPRHAWVLARHRPPRFESSATPFSNVRHAWTLAGASIFFFFFFFFLLSEGKFLRCRCWAVDWSANLREGWRYDCWAESFVFMVFDFVFGASVEIDHVRKQVLRNRKQHQQSARWLCSFSVREPDHVHKRSLPGNRSWALCKCVFFFFFFGVLRKKGSNYKRATEEQMEKRRNKRREIAGRGQPEKCGPRCHVAAENEQTKKVRPRESLLADRSRRSHVLHLCAREMMDNRRWRCADLFGNDWSTTGLESEREGLSKCPWTRTMASCIRPMHLQIWCQSR